MWRKYPQTDAINTLETLFVLNV